MVYSITALNAYIALGYTVLLYLGWIVLQVTTRNISFVGTLNMNNA
jgi:hypothetical protein